MNKKIMLLLISPIAFLIIWILIIQVPISVEPEVSAVIQKIHLAT